MYSAIFVASLLVPYFACVSSKFEFCDDAVFTSWTDVSDPMLDFSYVVSAWSNTGNKMMVMYSDLKPSEFSGELTISIQNSAVKKYLSISEPQSEELNPGDIVVESNGMFKALRKYSDGFLFLTFPNCVEVWAEKISSLWQCTDNIGITRCICYRCVSSIPCPDCTVRSTTPTTLVATLSSTQSEHFSSSTTSITTSSSNLTQSTTTPKPPLISYPNAQPGLQDLTNYSVTRGNVNTVLNDSLKYSRQGSGLSADDMTCLSLVMLKCSLLPNASKDVATLLFENVNYLQGASRETFAESNMPGKGDGSTQRILNAVYNTVYNLEHPNFEYLNGTQLGLRATDSDEDSLSISHDGNSFSKGHSESSTASITITPDALKGGTRAYVAYYATNKLFIPAKVTYSSSEAYGKAVSNDAEAKNKQEETTNQQNDKKYFASMNHKEKCSHTLSPSNKDPVLTGTVLGKTTSRSVFTENKTSKDKQIQAVITYNKEKALHPLHAAYVVSWWNKDESAWSKDKQCEMVTKTGKIVAHCYHLTDFTLLENGMKNDPMVCYPSLEGIAYFLNICSIVCLIVFLIFRSTRFLRKLNQIHGASTKQVLINRFLHRIDANEPILEDLMYCFFLLVFYVFFTCFKDQRSAHSACEVMGGISYFLFLCIPFQIFIFAVGDVAIRLQYKKFGKWCSPALALGISVALSFVITVGLGAGTDFFKREDQFCWIRPTYIVPGIVLPLVFVFSIGLMSTATVAWHFFDNRRVTNDLNTWQAKRERYLRIARIVQMQLHLGLPWLFQFGSLAFPYVTAWHFLFSSTNDSQGIIHLAIFFLFEKIEKMRLEHAEDRSEVDEKEKIKQEKFDRNLLENHFEAEQSFKRTSRKRIDANEENYEVVHYREREVVERSEVKKVSLEKRISQTTQYDAPGKSYAEILERLKKEGYPRPLMVELTIPNQSVEENWEHVEDDWKEAEEEEVKNEDTDSSGPSGQDCVVVHPVSLCRKNSEEKPARKMNVGRVPSYKPPPLPLHNNLQESGSRPSHLDAQNSSQPESKSGLGIVPSHEPPSPPAHRHIYESEQSDLERVPSYELPPVSALPEDGLHDRDEDKPYTDITNLNQTREPSSETPGPPRSEHVETPPSPMARNYESEQSNLERVSPYALPPVSASPNDDSPVLNEVQLYSGSDHLKETASENLDLTTVPSSGPPVPPHLKHPGTPTPTTSTKQEFRDFYDPPVSPAISLLAHKQQSAEIEWLHKLGSDNSSSYDNPGHAPIGAYDALPTRANEGPQWAIYDAIASPDSRDDRAFSHPVKTALDRVPSYAPPLPPPANLANPLRRQDNIDE
ncbi:hypothetical protein L596_029046 [Steinernema carpocapsae]|uniref:G-protein coupled receptors family 2 profile 2 domain-containing protein n=1 Tax=Steinernema carpocapsae TaxID=34508 RepID=A0A4U5LTG9_STECR|nr:hypothetical protein L596_029046 [Steinernema carpocapsae]